MDTAPDPQRHDALLGEADRILLWLIGELTTRLAPRGQGLGVLRVIFRHLLLPAEVLLRRALRVLADTLPTPKPSKPAAPRAGAQPPPKSATPTPRRPTFRLFEPEPRPRPDYMPVNQRPRISTPGLTPEPPAAAHSQPDPAALEEKLLRRVDALRAAFDNPLPLARRLLRLRMKPGARRLTLAYARPPGFRAKTLAAHGQDFFRQLNDAAEAAERAFPDSS